MAGTPGIADRFLMYVHRVPYRWAGASPRGWDCSGAVNYVMCHDLGYAIPGYRGGSFTGRVHGPSTTGWYGFPGMRNISRASVAKGDLVLWSSHMGIATSSTHYVSAYDTELGTVVEPIHGGGPAGETASFWRFTEKPSSAGSGGGGGIGGGGGGPAVNLDRAQRHWGLLQHMVGPGGQAIWKSIRDAGLAARTIGRH